MRVVRAPRKIRNRAKALRVDYTVAEGLLWNLLRDRQLAHLKFRRQHPVGDYIVDFVCASARLVVEVDGPKHAQRRGYDEKRTRFLNGRGYRVLRFSVDDVTRNGRKVLKAIELVATLTPTLSRVRELVQRDTKEARERESQAGGSRVRDSVQSKSAVAREREQDGGGVQ